MEDDTDTTEVFHLLQLAPLPVTAEDVRTTTCRDPMLARAYDLTLASWQTGCSDEVCDHTTLTVMSSAYLKGVCSGVHTSSSPPVFNLRFWRNSTKVILAL